MVVGSLSCSDNTYWCSDFPDEFDLCSVGGFLMVLVMVKVVDTLIPRNLVVGGCSFVARR